MKYLMLHAKIENLESVGIDSVIPVGYKLIDIQIVDSNICYLIFKKKFLGLF